MAASPLHYASAGPAAAAPPVRTTRAWMGSTTTRSLSSPPSLGYTTSTRSSTNRQEQQQQRLKFQVRFAIFLALSLWSLASQSLTLSANSGSTSDHIANDVQQAQHRNLRYNEASDDKLSSQASNVEIPETVVDAKVAAKPIPPSSLERLVQLASWRDDMPQCTSCGASASTKDLLVDNVTAAAKTVADNDDVIFVNCASPTVSNTPRSLLQCHDLLRERAGALLENSDLVTIVPRDDLFPALSATSPTTSSKSSNETFSLPHLEPLGTIHFHFRQPTNQSDHKGKSKRNVKRMAEDLEWLATTAVNHKSVPPYYALLGQTLGAAFGCTWRINNDTQDLPLKASSLYCPPVRDSTVNGMNTETQSWSVPHSVLAPVFPVMFQLPATTTATATATTAAVQESAKETEETAHTTTSSSTAESSERMVDPITPSVGVFHHAFAELNTSRILLHVPVDEESRTTKCACHNASAQQRHRQVLVQLNMCNVPETMTGNDSFEPFAYAHNITSTTSVEKSGAHVFDRAIFIGALWAWDFYHGSVEHVPRLLLLRDLIATLDPSIPVVVAKSHKGCLLHHYANMLGIGHRLVQLRMDHVIYAKTLYIPEPTTCLSLQPAMAQAHRHAIGHLLDEQRQSLPVIKPNYMPATTVLNADEISSSAAAVAPAVDTNNNATMTNSVNDDWIVVIQRRSKRFLRNHDEMMTALYAAYPNETFYVFDEQNLGLAPGLPQWDLFRRAKIVLAPHGAGLSNLVASPSQGSSSNRMATTTTMHVVEFLAHDSNFQLCFLHLALALNLHYHPLHMTHPRPVRGRSFSYVMDIPHVVQVVGTILASQLPAALPASNELAAAAAATTTSVDR